MITVATVCRCLVTLSVHGRSWFLCPLPSFSVASGPPEDKASPAAEVSQAANVAEERPSPPHSPADRPTSRRSASSSSEQNSSEDEDGEQNGTQRKIKSSVAQIRVSIKYFLLYNKCFCLMIRGAQTRETC